MFLPNVVRRSISEEPGVILTQYPVSRDELRLVHLLSLLKSAIMTLKSLQTLLLFFLPENLFKSHVKVILTEHCLLITECERGEDKI